MQGSQILVHKFCLRTSGLSPGRAYLLLTTRVFTIPTCHSSSFVPAAVFHKYLDRSSMTIWLAHTFLPNHLDGESYERCHSNERFRRSCWIRFHPPPPIRSRMWFLHDGALAHFGLNVRNILNAKFPGWWIGRVDPRSFPPRSPDLSCMEFFVRGHMRSQIYECPHLNRDGSSRQDCRCCGRYSGNACCLRKCASLPILQMWSVHYSWRKIIWAISLSMYINYIPVNKMFSEVSSLILVIIL